MQRSTLILSVVAMLGVSSVAVAYVGHSEPGPAGTRPTATKVATTRIVRKTLSDYWTETGSVGYRSPRPLHGAATGIVTWLPSSGAVISRGETLYRVADRPIVLLFGTTPFYRDLDTVGTVGKDVRILAHNLDRLGYDIGDQPASGTEVTLPRTGPRRGRGYQVTLARSDAVFTRSLKAAVRRWQQDIGVRPATGVVHVGDVLVEPGRVRVGTLTATVGDDASGGVMAVTDEDKIVDVKIDASRAGDVRSGQAVALTLPDSSSTPGTVSSVSTSVRSDASQDPSDATAKVDVVVRVDHAAALARLTSGDVPVRFTGTTRRNVLAVPVGALLALSGGGYGVQLAGGPLTAVDVGLFADGMVEVTGSRLTAGARVVTTS